MKLYRIMYHADTTGWEGTKELAELAVKGIAGAHYEAEEVPYTKPELLAWLNQHALTQGEAEVGFTPLMPDPQAMTPVAANQSQWAQESAARGAENERRISLEEEISNADYNRCRTLATLCLEQLSWHLSRMPKGGEA